MFVYVIAATGEETREAPRALHPIGDKAVISHIIDMFAENSQFHIVASTQEQRIKTYLEHFYPQRSFRFLSPDEYEQNLAQARQQNSYQQVYVANCELLHEAIPRQSNKTGEFDFSKSNEFLYFSEDSVIKFFEDEKIAANRVEKARLKPELFPRTSEAQNGFYSYPFTRGKTLYESLGKDFFSKLLLWFEKSLWTDEQSTDDFDKRCLEFYQDKTLSRVKDYFYKTKKQDTESSINGQRVVSTQELLSKVDWKSLSQGCASFIHGDLQFDNIIYDSLTDSFTLLDWRQDFAGLVALGDRYYDLAKLYGGLGLNYDLIKRGKFQYREEGDEVSLSFEQHPECADYVGELEAYILEKGYDLKKVKTITALIYLNMSPLHRRPFDDFLYSFGRLKLSEALALG